MTKAYFEPEIEVIKFNAQDVILSSSGTPQPITDEDGVEHSHYY